jgi:hypothetical protein
MLVRSDHRRLPPTGPFAHPHPQPTHPSSSPQPPAANAALLQIRVVCNDVRGILYLDDQYVSCFCADCEARVRAGHDRPIFGLRWGRAQAVPLPPLFP